MDNQYYRYCFQCDQWKSKSEIKEVDLGGGNKTFNCNVCRKDLGDQIHIFKCHTHPSEILKVWGTLEGQNKEKVFSDKCSQENKEEQPNKTDKGMLAMVIIGGTIILIAGGWFIYKLFEKKTKENK